MSDANQDGRRGFLKFTAGVAGCALAPGGLFAHGRTGAARVGRMAESLRSEDLSYIKQAAAAKDGGINIIGPKAGYSAQVGTLVSMLTWMQGAIGRSTEGMTQGDLDYLFDAKANTIGALMLHLAATEIFYQANTFESKDLSEEMKRKWGPAGDLGDAGRKTIKGHDRDYYLGILKETREKSLAEFAKRDDAWLMAVDKDWPWGPTDNYCKWVSCVRAHFASLRADCIFVEAVAGEEGRGVRQRARCRFKGPNKRLARVRRRKWYRGIRGDFLCHG
jgi:Protein of unknown function (DUF664)